MNVYKTGVLTLMILLTAAVTPLWSGAAAEMSVQVKQTQVRTAPSFLGRIVARLAYGDRVTVVAEQAGWKKVVLAGGMSGWVHGSALTPKKIVLRAGDVDVSSSVDSDELALAGKGFNAQVEGEFKDSHPEISFLWIDRMEKIVVSDAEMARFLKEGRVTPKGGF